MSNYPHVTSVQLDKFTESEAQPQRELMNSSRYVEVEHLIMAAMMAGQRENH